MPELPEVEVSRLGLLEPLVDQRIAQAVFRTPKLRYPLLPTLAERLDGMRITAISRRGKYLIFDCEHDRRCGWLILHLGMSGSVRLVPPGTPPQKHDHVDLVFEHTVLRFRDPRRFGLLCWHEGSPIDGHPLLAVLGIEPLSEDFNGRWLYAQTRKRTTPIKPYLMDAHRIVGVGNIYAAESLFLARISPLRPAGKLTRNECDRLADAVKTTLANAIAAGGSSQLSSAVYGREGLPCPVCRNPIKVIRQGGRSTFYCSTCQR